MHKLLICCVLLLSITSGLFGQAVSADRALTLRYDRPASAWEEALPLGNGKIGAMIFGRVTQERIQLNDNTLWSGYPDPGNNPEARKYLPQVRQAVSKGDYGAAALLWKKMQGPYSARYLPMADLLIDTYLPDTAISDYSRALDLRTALTTVNFTAQKTRFVRDAFISYPAKALVIRTSAEAKRKVTLTVRLFSKLKHEVVAVADDHLVLRGKAPMYVAHRDTDPEQIVYDGWEGEGVNFQVHVKLKAEGGRLTRNDSSITVTQADAVTLVVVGATSFNGSDRSPGLDGRDPSVEARRILAGISHKSYAQLRSAHVADYQSLFSRVSLNLGVNPVAITLPTDKRIVRFNGGEQDPQLIELYYQFGRYLLIASSRPGGPPANLQGIWNDHVQPPWGSNYTTNINTEMNYWPAEVTNLPECHKPLFDFIEQLSRKGAETALTNYGISNGWCAHHNSDLWAKASPAGGYDLDPRSQARWSCWPMAGAWLSTHMWEHFVFNGDDEFLKRAYPTMKGAALFLLAWLVEGPDGTLVTNPSTSPENVFKIDGKELQVSMASTMDMAITRQLFDDCLKAAGHLGIEDDFTKQLQAALPRLYPYQIGQYGQLQEWFRDWDDPTDHHRHISHLFGLHPGNQITPHRSPELTAAAKQSLLMRGDAGTGWSMAWKINWWARLGDGDHALKILKDGLTYIDPANREPAGGGTYPNLFDAHPPFQIDGNFGATAGITEMLMQSHDGELSILPALPSEWISGEVRGLKARGGFEVSIAWKDGKATRVVVTSTRGGNLRIRSYSRLVPLGASWKEAEGVNPNPLMQGYGAPDYQIKQGTELQKLNLNASLVIDIPTEVGNSYILVP